jgi:hypothetical protein
MLLLFVLVLVWQKLWLGLANRLSLLLRGGIGCSCCWFSAFISSNRLDSTRGILGKQRLVFALPFRYFVVDRFGIIPASSGVVIAIVNFIVNNNNFGIKGDSLNQA